MDKTQSEVIQRVTSAEDATDSSICFKSSTCAILEKVSKRIATGKYIVID